MKPSHPTIRRIIAAALLAGILCAPVAMAQDPKSEQAIKHRRAVFTAMSTYISRLLQTVQADRPFDAQQVRLDAQTVETLSRLPWEGFAPGSDRGDTRASPDIWLEEEKFQRLARLLEVQTSALAGAAATGDLARLKAAFLQTRDVCNACHKSFRTP